MTGNLNPPLLTERYNIQDNIGFKELLLFDSSDSLVNKASSVLALIAFLGRVKSLENHCNIYSHLIEQIESIRLSGSDSPDYEGVCLWLAATADEMLALSLGPESLNRKSFCSELFKRRDAGVYCYVLLDKWLVRHEMYLSHLQIAYLCMKVGFKGQYRRINQEFCIELQIKAHTILSENSCFQTIKPSSPRIKKNEKRTNRISLKRAISISLLLIICSTTGSVILSKSEQESYIKHLTKIRTENKTSLHLPSSHSRKEIRDAFYQ
ncbi:DotU family type IV/VI secretion system protein [Sansalvadorimonas sp. 2012CJ34-2]|uniref:DotU family type IV/VI secretion system protein n=1 Tax=Parendozoicomonas callyspongiae TaxID=2942213 RepID=A0ABT0PE47_9GAMM|nr:DotU family type IV/VI secretion system protein [Sansalvadorimonas sp. 2012CJ34-2]MCL6268828.1 DotU family type IV/VI secretion system protein [Sansalvadorimonas sp. 2012CJ34-2]